MMIKCSICNNYYEQPTARIPTDVCPACTPTLVARVKHMEETIRNLHRLLMEHCNLSEQDIKQYSEQEEIVNREQLRADGMNWVKWYNNLTNHGNLKGGSQCIGCRQNSGPADGCRLLWRNDSDPQDCPAFLEEHGKF